MISLLLISTMSAMIWLGPRVIKPNASGFSIAATGLQYLVTLSLLLSSTFLQLLVNAALLLNICSSAAVFALLINYQKIRLSTLIAAVIFIAANVWSMVHLTVVF